MAQTMNKVELMKNLSSFADSYKGHDLALMEVTEQTIGKVGAALDIPQNLQGQKMAYLIVPEAGDGELADSDVEKVAGGLGDKYDADCSKALAIGSASMTVINIG